MSIVITATALINRFEILVKDPITILFPPNCALETPPNAMTSLPLPMVVPNPPGVWASNYEPLGSNVEPTAPITVFQGTPITIEMFYLFHNMAMALTRIRPLRVFYTLGTSVVSEVAAPRRAALPPGYELYFPMPPIPPTAVTGNLILQTEMDNFLIQLRASVQNIRTNPYYAHAHIFSCHSNCHGACHGSRSRR